MTQINKFFSSRAEHAARLARLGALLEAFGWLWRASPYAAPPLAWSQRLPSLHARLLALDDAAVRRLSTDPAAAQTWLTPLLPELAELAAATALPPAAQMAGANVARSVMLERDVPGRKERQLRAMTDALAPVGLPVVDWCGGKGHLGRWLAHHWQVAVTTLDYDARLCEVGTGLARRAGVTQRFVHHDVLRDDNESCLRGSHAVALHACGDLHRALVRATVAAQVPALDLIPCCFHIAAQEDYRYFSTAARLPLTRIEARLAVTDESTAIAREQRLRDQAMAWKFGFSEMAQREFGERVDGRLRPGEKKWLRADFPAFCRALAAHRGWVFPAATPWAEGEAAGWQRLAQAQRLSIPRLAFRRVLEVYLVTDLALYLAEHDYDVGLSTLCAPHITPRNILLSARRFGS